MVGPYAAGEAFGSDGPLANDAIELGRSVMLVCIAIAVLKYRLYDIDRIISRVISTWYMSTASGFASDCLTGRHIYRLPTLAKFGCPTEHARSKSRGRVSPTGVHRAEKIPVGLSRDRSASG